MSFNEIYKMYTWNDICGQFEQNARSSSKTLFKFLGKHDRIQLREDGSVMIDVDNMNPFILYTSEFYYLLQAYTLLVTNNEAISYPKGEMKFKWVPLYGAESDLQARLKESWEGFSCSLFEK